MNGFMAKVKRSGNAGIEESKVRFFERLEAT
jgi:hypothetical protein